MEPKRTGDDGSEGEFTVKKKRKKMPSKKKERLIREDSPTTVKIVAADMLTSGADIAKELQIKDDQFPELPVEEDPFGE